MDEQGLARRDQPPRPGRASGWSVKKSPTRAPPAKSSAKAPRRPAKAGSAVGASVPSPSAAPRWMMKTKRRSVAACAIAMCGAARSKAARRRTGRGRSCDQPSIISSGIRARRAAARAPGRGFRARDRLAGGRAERAGEDERAERAGVDQAAGARRRSARPPRPGASARPAPTSSRRCRHSRPAIPAASTGWPNWASRPAAGCASTLRRRRRARRAAIDQSQGVRNFGRRRPGLGRLDDRAVDGRQVAAAAQPGLFEPADHSRAAARRRRNGGRAWSRDGGRCADRRRDRAAPRGPAPRPPAGRSRPSICARARLVDARGEDEARPGGPRCR